MSIKKNITNKRILKVNSKRRQVACKNLELIFKKEKVMQSEQPFEGVQIDILGPTKELKSKA